MVTGVTHDSRNVRRGDLFVGLPGENVHGAQHAAVAVASGAAAILTDPPGARIIGERDVPILVVDRPRERLGPLAAWVYGEPAAGMLLLGVTGTNGKTTSTYLMERGLAAAGHHTALIGTVETRIGDEALPSVRTTPEAPDLQALFALMREQGVTAVAMEVSSHALAAHRVAGASFDVAVFTNLSEEHLDFHADLDDYFAAKASLFTPRYSRIGVVNIDDEYGRKLVGIADIPVVTFSVSGREDADWRAAEVRRLPAGSAFQLVGPGGVEASGQVALAGEFNVANAVGAIVALVEGGVPLHTAVGGVGSLRGVPGRMEAVDAGQPFPAFVDYAHTPDAVETLLHCVRGLTSGRVIVVLGCGGDRDKRKRPHMGQAAARLADLAILTSDNPRSEDPIAILSEMLSGVTAVRDEERAHIVVEPDRRAAVELAVSRARPDDVVVVAGKGHEQGQEVAGVVHPFDDRTVLRKALESARVAGGPR